MATMPGLRPLAFGEILDVGIKLCLRNWRVLVLCVVWLVLPAQIVSVAVLLSVAPDALDPTAQEAIAPGEETRFFVAQGVSALIQGLVYLVATAACFKAIADAYLGTGPTAKRSLSFGLRRVPRLLALSIVSGLAFAIPFGALVGLAALTTPAVLALLLVFIPAAIYVGVSWSLGTCALLFEDVGPIKALRRSWALVHGSWWRVFGILAVGVILVSVLSGVLQGMLTLIPAALADGNDVVLALATVVAGTAAVTLTTPFTAAVFSLVYFDQRVRREGFDLELLAKGLGERPPEPGSAAVDYRPAEITPEQRAQAPYWPPPPGWQPPPAEPDPQSESESEPKSGSEPPPPPPGGWQPPTPQRWPPETPERGPGGL